jgi:hypothetical protein
MGRCIWLHYLDLESEDDDDDWGNPEKALPNNHPGNPIPNEPLFPLLPSVEHWSKGFQAALSTASHFGIGTDEEESFESIGKRLGLTSERVRQLHNQGLAKLRRKLKGDNRNLTALANYLG